MKKTKYSNQLYDGVFSWHWHNNWNTPIEIGSKWQIIENKFDNLLKKRISMIISIHQPNFMPWFPFYDKIQKSDTFVFLTHCQFQKNNYQNRFFYRDNWRTLSVNNGLEPMLNKRYINCKKDWNKIKINLKDKKSLLELYDECISENLINTNINIILKTINLLKIKTNICYDSPTNLLSTDRIIDICKKNKATTYLSGTSGKNYLDLEKFEKENINVVFQELSDDIKIHTLDFL